MTNSPRRNRKNKPNNKHNARRGIHRAFLYADFVLIVSVCGCEYKNAAYRKPVCRVGQSKTLRRVSRSYLKRQGDVDAPLTGTAQVEEGGRGRISGQSQGVFARRQTETERLARVGSRAINAAATRTYFYDTVRQTTNVQKCSHQSLLKLRVALSTASPE